MKLSCQMEEYLEAIYNHEEMCREPMRTTALAKMLGVTPGTVTQITKKMSELGLVKYRAYKGVRLTERGRRIARKIVRSHRVFEIFLHQKLGLSLRKAHEEACKFEHDAGKDTVEMMHMYLGYPEKSIDGKEIPGSKPLVPLLDLKPGQRGRIMCIEYGGACVTSKLLGLGIAPGEKFEFLRRVGRGPVVLKVGNSEVAIGRGIAGRIKVVLE